MPFDREPDLEAIRLSVLKVGALLRQRSFAWAHSASVSMASSTGLPGVGEIYSLAAGAYLLVQGDAGESRGRNPGRRRHA
jgi:hypothetical protein